MIRLLRRITEKVRPQKLLRMLANFLRIPANFSQSLRLFNNPFAEFIVNPLRMLRITTNVLRSLQMLIIIMVAYYNNYINNILVMVIISLLVNRV